MFDFDKPFMYHDIIFLHVDTVEGENIGGGIDTGEGTESWYYHIALPCEHTGFTHCSALNYSLIDNKGFMVVETYY
jgi:hypothetical protein